MAVYRDDAKERVSSISRSRRSPLTTWLCALDEERLDRVLRSRPDAVAEPEPRVMGELADRLQRPGSVALAVGRLPLPCLQAAEALAALGEKVPRGGLAALLGAESGEAALALDDALAVMADHALVWTDDAGMLRVAPPLRQAWDTPLGLGPPLAVLVSGLSPEELRGVLSKLGIKVPGSKQRRLAALLEHHSSAERILAVVAQAPTGARELLERRAAAADASPLPVLFGSQAPDHGPETRWAVERGLLVPDRHRWGSARMPAEVARALRGPDWRAPFDAVPPSVVLVSAAEDEVAREAAWAAGAFAAQAASVLGVCAVRPPAELKSGGVGARELARIGKSAQCDDAVVRLVLECAHAGGLLAREGDRVLPTGAYDAWAEREPAGQLAELIRAWWELPLTPTGSRDEDGKALPALARMSACQGCVQARHGLLTALQRLPGGHGAKDPSDLAGLIAWHRPTADELPQDTTPFASLIREAVTLGVLSQGTLSPLGAALPREDPEELLRQARHLLPPATGRARIGSDLTAAVLGTPSTRLATLLDSLADREAQSTASLWRFSGSSIRRALDAGRDREEIEADLTAIADGPLPQPLTYLIGDAARRHGHLRVVSATCVIHGDDPGLLAEVCAHRKLARLGLRRVAPTVLVADAAPNDGAGDPAIRGVRTSRGDQQGHRPHRARGATAGRRPGAGTARTGDEPASCRGGPAPDPGGQAAGRPSRSGTARPGPGGRLRHGHRGDPRGVGETAVPDRCASAGTRRSR